MGFVPREMKRPQLKKGIFLGDPQEGGITLFGGRNFWGCGKEWSEVNDGRGVGSTWKVMWGVKGGKAHERGPHLSHNITSPRKNVNPPRGA
jgi:hypothetical protein